MEILKSEEYYDEALDFAFLDNNTEKIELAVSRLENPYNLSDDNRLMYEKFLKGQKANQLKTFVDGNQMQMFPLLVKYRAIKKATVPPLAEYAQNVRRFDILSYLLNVTNDFRTQPKKMNIAPKFTAGESAESPQKLPQYSLVREGDIVWMGKTPMPWVVLEKKNKKVLLISKYAIECKPFNFRYEITGWHDSTIRKWLNEEFVNQAFTDSEKQLINKVYIDDDDVLSLEGNSSSMADDIFLLSMDEAVRYFKTDDERRARVTKYAVRHSLWTLFEDYGHWWLRNAKGKTVGAAYVKAYGPVFKHGGTIISNGFLADYDNYGVRPAVYLNLN